MGDLCNIQVKDVWLYSAWHAVTILYLLFIIISITLRTVFNFYYFIIIILLRTREVILKYNKLKNIILIDLT